MFPQLPPLSSLLDDTVCWSDPKPYWKSLLLGMFSTGSFPHGHMDISPGCPIIQKQSQYLAACRRHLLTSFWPPSSWNLLCIKSIRMLLSHKSAGGESEGPGRTRLTGNWLHSLENTSRSRPHRWQRAILQKKKKLNYTRECLFFLFLGFQCQEFLGSYALMWLAKHYRHKAN